MSTEVMYHYIHRNCCFMFAAKKDLRAARGSQFHNMYGSIPYIGPRLAVLKHVVHVSLLAYIIPWQIWCLQFEQNKRPRLRYSLHQKGKDWIQVKLASWPCTRQAAFALAADNVFTWQDIRVLVLLGLRYLSKYRLCLHCRVPSVHRFCCGGVAPKISGESLLSSSLLGTNCHGSCLREVN